MKRAAILITAILVAACGGAKLETAGGGPTFAVERTATGGPVTLTVRLSSDEIGLAETLLLEEEVDAEPGFDAELPEFLPEELEGLGVLDVDERPPERQGGATRLVRRLTLEPERSGKLVIPAREAWFSKEGGEGESSVATKPIEVTVRPIEDAAATALPPPRPALRTDQVGGGGGLSPWWAALLALPAAAGAVVVLRRRERAAPPPRPAHEIAWESLRRLVALDLLGKGEVERFFVILSAILREYVERRFGVRAPDRTTEEFLAEAADHPSLAPRRAELAAFLETADRVKFARHSPAEAEVQRAFDRAKAFVTATAEGEATGA